MSETSCRERRATFTASITHGSTSNVSFTSTTSHQLHLHAVPSLLGAALRRPYPPHPPGSTEGKLHITPRQSITHHVSFLELCYGKHLSYSCRCSHCHWSARIFAVASRRNLLLASLREFPPLARCLYSS